MVNYHFQMRFTRCIFVIITDKTESIGTQYNGNICLQQGYKIMPSTACASSAPYLQSHFSIQKTRQIKPWGVNNNQYSTLWLNYSGLCNMLFNQMFSVHCSLLQVQPHLNQSAADHSEVLRHKLYSIASSRYTVLWGLPGQQCPGIILNENTTSMMHYKMQLYT